MMRYAKVVMAALAIACIATPAMGEGYVELTPWTTVNGGGASTSHFGAVIEGQTSYHNVNFPGRITRVTNLNGVQTYTELITNAQWLGAQTASSTANMSSYYGLGISGDNVQWADSGTDSIWRVDKNTAGSIAEYVSKAEIMAHTGQAGVALLTPSTVTPTGELVFYEGSHDSILVTTGTGTITTLVTEAELVALHTTGSNSCNGGLDYDASGNLYWGDSSSDSMYMKAASDGTLSKVLDVSEIIAVSEGTAAGFGDILGGDDGLMYFYESSMDNIMRFDPANPVSTLEIYISEQELLDGPMGSDGVMSLTWYDDGGLAWHRFNGYGTYTVPEPASLALLGLGGLALLRRRR